MVLHTAAPMDHSTDTGVMRRHNWFSLFFWPAVQRIFLFGKKLQVPRERPNVRSRPETLTPRTPAEEARKCAVPQEIIEVQIEYWIRWTLESNIALVAALERLRTSYKLLLAGTPAKDSDKVLLQVEVALKDTEKTRM
jgi:hypothetical protein